MIGAVDLRGAGGRLLPEDVPLRFFGAATAFHILAWAALVTTAEQTAGFVGGPGPALATAHTLTIGVLVTTAVGASLQMLPVALGCEAPPRAPCTWIFWLLIPGALALITGFALVHPMMIQIGAGTVVAALGLYGYTLARVVWRSHEMRAVVHHVWAALVFLVVGAGLAVALALDYSRSVLPDHGAAAAAHAVLFGFGFMGMLALGLSQVLVPLFAVALVPYERWAIMSFWSATAGIALASLGCLFRSPELIAAGLIAGVAAAGLHLRMMADLLGRRLRKRLSPEFVLIRASWFFLPLTLVAGAILATDFGPATMPALFGFLLLFGWLLTLLVGVLQRVIPLLASMHAARPGRSPISPSQLTAKPPLRLHRWCHLAAVAVVAVGLAADVPLVVRGGAVVGTVGAAAFAAFALTVLRRMRAKSRRQTAVGAPG